VERRGFGRGFGRGWEGVKLVVLLHCNVLASRSLGPVQRA